MQIKKYWTWCSVICRYRSLEIVNGFSFTNPKFKNRNFYKTSTRTLKPDAVISSDSFSRVPNHVIKNCSNIAEESTASICSVTECALVLCWIIFSPCEDCDSTFHKTSEMTSTILCKIHQKWPIFENNCCETLKTYTKCCIFLV